MRFLSSTSFKCKQNPNLTLLSIRYISNVSKSFYVSVTKEFWYLRYLKEKVSLSDGEERELYKKLIHNSKHNLEMLCLRDLETFDRIKKSFEDFLIVVKDFENSKNQNLLSIGCISTVNTYFYVSVTKEFWYLHYLGFKILDVPWEKIEFYQTLFITCKDDLEVIRKEDPETFDRIKSSFKCIIF